MLLTLRVFLKKILKREYAESKFMMGMTVSGIVISGVVYIYVIVRFRYGFRTYIRDNDVFFLIFLRRLITLRSSNR
jgi:hypothetical protein